MAHPTYATNSVTYTTTATGTDSAWTNWCAYNTGTTSTTGGDVWKIWVMGSNSTTTSYSAEAWASWNTSQTLTVRGRGYGNWPAVQGLPETDEERIERDRREAEALAAIRARQEEKKAAEQRARDLLVAHLDEEQRAEFQEKRQFHLITRSGKRYRVERGRSGNITLINEAGKATEQYCIHTADPVPVEDNMLAQKLLLEADEQEFLRVANKTRLAA